RALGGSHQLGPALVHVLAERRRWIGDLAVDGQVDEVFELAVAESAPDEAELDGRLLTTLREVLLVEREAQLAVFENKVLARVVVTAARRFHVNWPRIDCPPGRRDNTAGSCFCAHGAWVFASPGRRSRTRASSCRARPVARPRARGGGTRSRPSAPSPAAHAD